MVRRRPARLHNPDSYGVTLLDHSDLRGIAVLAREPLGHIVEPVVEDGFEGSAVLHVDAVF